LKRKRLLPFTALLVALLLVAAACGGDEGGTEEGQAAPPSEANKGGTYRIATAGWEFTGAFDPTAEYLGTAWSYYTNLLVRNLVTYKHIAGPEGNELVADLATEVPEASNGGRKWTFTLKDGVKFGPPVDRDITSDDIKYAFERLANPDLVAGYGFYYTVIDGFSDFADGKADEISGIETPDDKTITFTTTEPVGDFLYRLAMPAAGPIPREVGQCFEKAGEYGRFVISSGPYMIEGSDDLDASSCKTMKPLSGYKPNDFLTFVRNPNYDPATDSPEVREALPDRFEITTNTNTNDLFNKIEAGELEGSPDSPPAEFIRRYTQDESLRDRLPINNGDRTWYLTMNLTTPPFDDINVRKAVNYAINKEALRRVWGGPAQGDIATFTTPPVMYANAMTADDFDPYATDNYAGDIDKAKEFMAKSKYDSDGDGVCDDPSCDGILHIARNTPPHVDMVPVIEDNLKELGMTFTTRELENSYDQIQVVSNNVPFGSNAGWGKDYADPSTFAVLFDSRSIVCDNNINYSMVGATPQTAKECGGEGSYQNIPSVDDKIDECNALTDDERTTCWTELDREVMENVVPWVPYLWANNIDLIGPGVSKFEYDQFSGETAWAHVAVDESKQK
jgi:peptide/nickel transport system substrate-binding protein